MPVDPPWKTWCSHCDWHVDSQSEPEAELRPATQARRRAELRDARLNQELARAESEDSRHALKRIASYGLALAVNLASPALLGFAAWLFVRFGLIPGTVLGGLGLVLLAFELRPRFGHLPRGVVIVPRGQAMALYGLADQIAEELGASPVSWIGFDARHRASTRTIGPRRRRLIVIGLPLWDVLSWQERVATIAHEVAHGRGGNLLHRALIGSSLQSLDSLYLSLRRTPFSDRPWMSVDLQGLTRSSEAIAARLLHGFAFIPRWLFFLQLNLARSASPLAEYRADQATARVASGAAATAALDKLSLAETCQSLLSRAIRTRDLEIWATLRLQLSRVPERERERLRRVARRRGQTADEYHPPTCIRIGLLAAQSARTAKLGLDAAGESAIDSELIPVRRWLSEALTS
jgi:hypothetical protein